MAEASVIILWGGHWGGLKPHRFPVCVSSASSELGCPDTQHRAPLGLGKDHGKAKVLMAKLPLEAFPASGAAAVRGELSGQQQDQQQSHVCCVGEGRLWCRPREAIPAWNDVLCKQEDAMEPGGEGGTEELWLLLPGWEQRLRTASGDVAEPSALTSVAADVSHGHSEFIKTLKFFQSYGITQCCQGLPGVKSLMCVCSITRRAHSMDKLKATWGLDVLDATRSVSSHPA